jgi:YVTN family beta-propeller protein
MITTTTTTRSFLALALLSTLAMPLDAEAKTAPRVLQTSSAGTTVTVIDPAVNKVVGIVHDIEVNRASVASLDGSRFYVTGQFESELAVIDARTFQVVKRVPLDGHPDYISISKDGRQLYIALDTPGAVEVLDTTTLARVKSIPIKGAVHYAYVTPDGSHIVAASVAGKIFTVIDAHTLEPEWSMTFEGGVRPIAFETSATGATTRLFVELSDFHGFAVVDFAAHKEVTRVTLPDIPGKIKNLDGIQGAPAHGLEITPDGKLLWATSKWYGYAFAYSLPDLKLVGQVEVGLGPEWMSITPDGKRMYVSLAGDDAVAVIDIKTMKVTARIPVGYVPKANVIANLQVE